MRNNLHSYIHFSQLVNALHITSQFIHSPLCGEIKAVDFYPDLFKDTSKSTITLLNIFKSNNPKNGGGHFRYDWILKDRTSTSFECVDVFQFADDGRIKELTIIYGTSEIRSSFEKIKDR